MTLIFCPSIIPPNAFLFGKSFFTLGYVFTVALVVVLGVHYGGCVRGDVCFAVSFGGTLESAGAGELVVVVLGVDSCGSVGFKNCFLHNFMKCRIVILLLASISLVCIFIF